MGRYAGLRPIFAAAMVWLLGGCAGVAVSPTPVPARSPMGVPQPTATQIAVGANPHPASPRINPFVAQVTPPGRPGGTDPYRWLEQVHSGRTRHWILRENELSARSLAAIPQRAWIKRRLEQLEGARRAGAPDDMVVQHAFYIGPDGSRLPMEMAYRRDLARDGNQATLLTVYRATGQPVEPLMQPFVLAWLEMGGVYARAQVRDGLAPTPAPRGAATLPDRSIALGDLFAAGQSLIDHGYTRRARLGIYGRGFGGLMAGAAVALRPDFFGVALPTGTWPEYRRITSGNCFPPTLITTAAHGGDIRPWQGYELAAVLQAEQICGHPILIRVASGEGRQEPAAARRERAADELAFAAKWLGVAVPRP
jgi:prolyl oligopeptidase PreP (S9A serine peptidase family)